VDQVEIKSEPIILTTNQNLQRPTGQKKSKYKTKFSFSEKINFLQMEKEKINNKLLHIH
jgi:hypothetical protein